MKKEVIQELYNSFEAVAVEVEGIECWNARELQLLLGYSKWENFSKVIDKAKIACENAGCLVSDHFPDVRKMVRNEIASIDTSRLSFINYFREILPFGIPQK